MPSRLIFVSCCLQLGILPFVIGFLDGVATLIYDGLADCRSGLGTRFQGCSITYPAPWSGSRANEGYLAYAPSNASSAEAVIDELDILLTSGRLDVHSRARITEEYLFALNVTSCPVDRSAELCGRLTPGQQLLPGEHLRNALGEVLCLTYDGVARHVGTDGREVFSTAFGTRGTAVPLRCVRHLLFP